MQTFDHPQGAPSKRPRAEDINFVESIQKESLEKGLTTLRELEPELRVARLTYMVERVRQLLLWSVLHPGDVHGELRGTSLEWSFVDNSYSDSPFRV